MLRGDFETAWRETDRWEIPRRWAEQADSSFTRAPHHLLWNGKSFVGQRVLIRCEHGLGDAIQFIRYCPLVRSRARSVIVKAQPALLDLFAEMSGIDLLIDAWLGAPEPEHDIAIECMELAYAFRHTAETLPRHTPYLPVSKYRLAELPGFPPASPEFRIGLLWAASEWNPLRSVPLQELAPLASLPVRLFSLQQGEEQAQLARSGLPITPLSSFTTNLAAAAAAMLRLDAVVTVDSMAAHLAGALGVPVYLLLTHRADWRWMENRDDSPWYPSMRIMRQAEAGNWAPVIADLTELLASRL